MNRIIEFYGQSTRASDQPISPQLTMDERCPFLYRKCTKIRKSKPNQTIGTCTVAYGKEHTNIIICPHRLLQRHQIFTDCIHLLKLHKPGNTLHIVPEVMVPGGNVDYFLVSSRGQTVKDFVGIEIQAVDTSGTVWPERVKLLKYLLGEKQTPDQSMPNKPFGMNWKMTAKTTLMQLHHKIETFEALNKHLVLVLQDHLLSYMRRSFDFAHMESATMRNAMHIHSYGLKMNIDGHYFLDLDEGLSTDGQGVAKCLGLQQDAHVGLAEIYRSLESKISDDTILLP